MKRSVDLPQRASRVRAACALAAVLACAPVATASAARGDGASSGASSAESTDVQARVQKLLHESLAQSDDAEQLARRLIALGRAAIPELLDELTRHWTAAHAPVLAREGASLSAHGVLRALAQLPREAVELELARRSRGTPTRDTRAAALLLLGEIASGDELARLLHVVAPQLTEIGGDEELENALVDALGSVARRDASLWPNARRLASAQAPALRAALLRAAGACASAAAADFLTESFDALPEQRVELLMQVGVAAPRLARPLDERLAAEVRELLAEERSDVLADAALLAGRLEDSLAAERLIALLGNESAGVRANAVWSLQQISGLRLRDDTVRWTRWLADENAWWRNAADAELRALHGMDTPRARVAILEIGRHRLHRDRLAAALVSALDHEDPTVVQLACAQLQTLRSRVGLPALVALLEHPTQSVRWSAWTSLRALTGKNLPEDAGAWRAAVSAL